MARRLSTLAALVLFLGLTAGAVGVENANAYRVTPNPATVEGNWTTGTLWERVDGRTLRFPCEATSCTPTATSKIAKARQAAATVPKLRALGTLALAATAFDVGWTIGRVVDTKYLHLSGEIGRIDATWTVGSWLWSTTFLRWQLMIGAPGSGLSQRISVPWPAGAAQGTEDGVCTGSGNGDWTGPAHCGSQWGQWNAYQERQIDQLGVATGATMAIDSSVSHCGQGVIAGVADECLVVSMAETVMESAIGADGPLLDADPTPGTNLTTNITMPGKPAFGDAAAIATRAALLEDETEAQAAAGTPAEEDTAAWQAGEASDPAWEGYPIPEFVMPDCTGLTVAGCNSALETAGHIGTITELELDIATADVTKPAGAVVTTSPGAFTSTSADTEVFLSTNPDPLPLELPEPLLGETYLDYIERLQALGYVGTITEIALTETTGDPALGPDAPVIINLPVRTPLPSTNVRVGLPWPSPTPRVWPDTDITIYYNPPTFAPVPNPGGPASGPVTPPGVDFGPITDIDWGCRFPWGLVCYAIDVTEWFNVSPDAPSFTFDFPEVEVGEATYGGGGDYTVDLNVMDEYMAMLRTLMSVALWIGGVYLLASRLLNFRAAGDPGQAVDEGLDWQS